MTSETILDVRCRCGGKLKETVSEVEFFGIDFGVRKADICTECGSEYLSQELMEEIEREVKSRKLFGLERRGHIAKSGNSLVVRIPKEMAESLKVKRDMEFIMYPSELRKLVIEVKD